VKSAYIKVFIYVRVHKDFMLIPVHSDKKFAFKADVTSYNHNIKIPNKFLKMWSSYIWEWLHWKKSTVVPIYEKNDKTDCSKYRWISLLHTA